MLLVIEALPIRILSSSDEPVAQVVNAEGRAPVCLVCEHASSAIPSSLGDLGLAGEDRLSHAVWDLGAEALARDLSRRLDAPLVLARVSRLVYDCNRPPERADSTPERTEAIDVPGNRGLSESERAARTREIYDSFHATLSRMLDGFSGPPALVTVHSFTPTWHGTPRATELGLLHDDDPRLAIAMLAAADTALRTELNKPYSAADGVTHTLARHGTARGLPNVMIEVRNDFLTDEARVARVGAILDGMLTAGLQRGADAA